MNKDNFNSDIVNFFQKISNLEYPAFLAEHYPHILIKMHQVWEKPVEFHKYTKSLTMTENSRQGFEPLAFKEILKLEIAYDKLGKR